jgi:hypothetical protein
VAYRGVRPPRRAHLDALLEEPPDDLDGAVRALWTDPATGGRGLRAVLDAHADNAALAAAHENDRRLVHSDLGIELPQLGDDRAPAPPPGGWRRPAPAA